MSLVTNTAQAESVCVTLDEARDMLSPEDRSAARTLLCQAFQTEGQTVVEQNCSHTYTAYHVKLGDSVTAVVSGPQGTRQGRVAKIEELPSLYSQLVRALLSGKALDTAGEVVTRQNVTTDQAVPTRAEADSLLYLRLGPATMLGGSANLNPGFGFGYRYELDRLGIDASMNLVVPSGDAAREETSGGGSLVKLLGLYFFDPLGNHSLYAGAGISWGAVVVEDDHVYSGSGLQGELALGWAFLRASTIRMFLQLDASLPFYLAEDNDQERDDSRYAPSFGLSFGIGWGGSKTRTVRVVD